MTDNAAPRNGLAEAILFASIAHQGQVRDGAPTLPYIAHPLEVVAILLEHGTTSDEVLIAAALHDCIEETDRKDKQIAEKFGKAVASIVAELTRKEPDAGLQGQMSKQDWYALRNDLMIEGIRKMSPVAKQIKLADRLSNFVEASRVRSPKKLARYITQTEQILNEIDEKCAPTLHRALREAVNEVKEKI